MNPRVNFGLPGLGVWVSRRHHPVLNVVVREYATSQKIFEALQLVIFHEKK